MARIDANSVLCVSCCTKMTNIYKYKSATTDDTNGYQGNCYQSERLVALILKFSNDINERDEDK